MGPEQFVDLTMSSDLDVPRPNQWTPQKLRQPHYAQQPGLPARRPISPPALNRPASSSGRAEDDSMGSTATSRGNLSGAQKARDELKPTSLAPKTNAGAASRASQRITSPAQTSSHPSCRTPKHQTPKKIDWTTDTIEVALREFSLQLGKDSAKNSAHSIYYAWKKMAPKPVRPSRKNWFTNMRRAPTDASQDTLKLKLKHVTQGRGGKQEKREHYQVIDIMTDKEPVPTYDFHHVHITKNILSPNTMLSFVPHLRDLADHEEPKYRRWLENLESMDKTSGFATLSRQEKVRKTSQKERATTLLLYLDHWLGSLSIENCSKATLIRHMAHQSDALTPQQASSIRNSYSDNGTLLPTKGVRMFMDAFDRVFNEKKVWKEGAVTLQEVLLLDKSVDSIVDSKKYLKDTPSQVRPADDNTTVETVVETYSFLGCTICSAHSCEHGEYGHDNERKRFSIEGTGGIKPLIRKKAIQARAETSKDGPKARKPCCDECYINGRPGTRAKGWSETEMMQLKTAAALLNDLNTPVQCAAAIYIGRPCWDINRQLEKMELNPTSPGIAPLPLAPTKVKSISWFDRFKKTLLADWQEQTITHEHHKKDHFDPCHHDGPCTKENCACLKNGLMCERFCTCTVEACAVKFTGCACHAQGRTCLPRQRGEKPCICVQLNRECDPALCGTCGAVDRANPRNMDDDELFKNGCQNCALQRGKSKSVIHGKSTIEGCGYGLFTTENISQDDFVIEYVGELISQDEGVRREARRGDVFEEEHNSSYLFTLLEQEGIWVDAEVYGNLSRYINHQDDFGKAQGCNITPKILYVGGEYRIKFSALRDIDAGEELFFNYGENFPNLTKKLLDEQKAEEKKVKKQGARKEGTEEADDPTKPHAKKRGHEPKQKQKRKSFATRLESDLEDDDTDEIGIDNLSPDPNFARARKRKRDAGSDSDEGEYRPGFPESDARETSRSKIRGRQGPGDEDSMQEVESEGVALFGKPARNRSEAQADNLDMVGAGTSRYRINKTRNIIEDDDDDDEIDEDLDAEYEDKGTTRRAAADDPAAEEDTPSRLQTRRQKAQETLYASPLCGVDRAVDHMDLDAHPKPAPGPQPLEIRRKRGRPRKKPLPEEIAETDDNADDSIDGSANTGKFLSQSITQDSDDSSNSQPNRGRVRKRPARYNE